MKQLKEKQIRQAVKLEEAKALSTTTKLTTMAEIDEKIAEIQKKKSADKRKALLNRFVRVQLNAYHLVFLSTRIFKNSHFVH